MEYCLNPVFTDGFLGVENLRALGGVKSLLLRHLRGLNYDRVTLGRGRFLRRFLRLLQ